MKRLMQLRFAVPFATAALMACGQGCPSTNPDGNNNNGQDADKGLPGENSRTAFQSQCAQNVIVCTVTFPKPDIQITAGAGQTVTPTPRGFIVQGSDGDGSEVVKLDGTGSDPGQGATQLFYAWSQGAADANPLTMNPGPVFSTVSRPSIRMAEGFHYVRLTLRNDIYRDQIESPDGEVILTNVYQSDFKEIEIEVRD